MTQLTDEQYWKLANTVYKDSALNINEIKNLTEKELKNIDSIKTSDNTKWVTINSINTDSGLQAMAVIPMSEYKDLCSGKITEPQTLVFATRGSELGEDGWMLKRQHLQLLVRTDCYHQIYRKLYVMENTMI
ncbi:hypothetical protein ACWOFR_05585 [Carnobacterium gallinarum]|uniref:hypothetical protein n=1 Tax=Carnobacterium gallinarum TaxID=2749 RepID=UPI00054E9D67|nr:hypothetical protein [Carnobacterium gallinarum]